MPFSTDAKNTMLDAVGITHISAHTADPGDSGTSEVSGGSYARQSITFSAATAGAIDSSNTPVIDIPGGTTVTHVGFWSAVSGGTYLGSSAITPEVYASDGTLTVTDADLDLNG